jgi:hypothetical protein
MITNWSSARLDTTSGIHKRKSNLAVILAISLRDGSLSVDLWYAESTDNMFKGIHSMLG